MLIAHLDSIAFNPEKQAPGADDNGSGVAAILEIARIIKDISMKNSISFCIFSNEETGTRGSKAFVKFAKKEGINIKAVINLDVLGYNRPKKPFYLKAVKSHKSFKHKLKAVYRMIKNYCLGYFHGEDVLKVTGRPPNGDLVKRTSKIIRKYSELKVDEIISDDCG